MNANITGQTQTNKKFIANEEHLRLILANIKDYAIFTFDLDGYITRWNTGAENIFGFAEDEAIGQHAGIIFTPEDRAKGAHLKEMGTALAKGRAEDERWHIRQDGSRFYASGVLTLLQDGALMGYVKVARDLTERIRLEEDLRRSYEEMELKVAERTRELKEANQSLQAEVTERKQSEEERGRLVKELVSSQEVERRRIARDLHDHLGQQLTALRLQLETLKKECGESKLCELIEQAQTIAERLDSEVDFLAWELRPAVLDDLGLNAALANFVKEWSTHFNIAAEFHSTGLDKKRLSPETEANIYRIGQEALNNVYKHAQATDASVLLERRDHHAVLIIEDNGVGFDPQEKNILKRDDRGMGLISMKERASILGGSLEIESTPGKGTTVYARIPAIFVEPEETIK